MANKQTPPPKRPQFKGYVRYTQLGLEMGITIAGLTGAGYYLDSNIPDIKPIGILVGSLLGVGVALYKVIKEFL